MRALTTIPQYLRLAGHAGDGKGENYRDASDCPKAEHHLTPVGDICWGVEYYLTRDSDFWPSFLVPCAL